MTWCLLVVWRTSFGKKGQFQGQLWRSEEEVAVRQMHIFALIIKLHFCTLFGTGHWVASTALQMLSPQQLQLQPVSHLGFFKVHVHWLAYTGSLHNSTGGSGRNLYYEKFMLISFWFPISRKDYSREFGSAGAGASWRALGLKTAGAYSTTRLKISGCKRWCPKDLQVRESAAPALKHSLYRMFFTQSPWKLESFPL